jgi:hypothetical protein
MATFTLCLTQCPNVVATGPEHPLFVKAPAFAGRLSILEIAMKTLIASLIALAVLGSTAASAAPRHHHRAVHHHHRVVHHRH